MSKKIMELSRAYDDLLNKRKNSEIDEAEFKRLRRRLFGGMRFVSRRRLLRRLKSDDSSVRRWCVLCLGAKVHCWDRYNKFIFGRSVLGILSRLLEMDVQKTLKSGGEAICREEDVEVRLAVVQTLGRFLPWQPAIRGLVTALGDPNQRVMRVAFVRLRTVTDPEVLSDVILQQHQADPKLKQAIGQYFDDFDPDVLREAFERALDKNRDPELKRDIFASRAFQRIHRHSQA